MTQSPQNHPNLKATCMPNHVGPRRTSLHCKPYRSPCAPLRVCLHLHACRAPACPWSLGASTLNAEPFCHAPSHTKTRRHTRMTHTYQGTHTHTHTHTHVATHTPLHTHTHTHVIPAYSSCALQYHPPSWYSFTCTNVRSQGVSLEALKHAIWSKTEEKNKTEIFWKIFSLCVLIL
jgi:hypothetical protein